VSSTPQLAPGMARMLPTEASGHSSGTSLPTHLIAATGVELGRFGSWRSPIASMI
jgi:hypothetical protein